MLDLYAPRSHPITTDFLADLSQVLALVPAAALSQAVELLLEARANRKRVYIIGNGGSAATASHFVCDLVKTAQVDGHEPLRAFSLTDNTALFSAWANDSVYEATFAEQVGALVDPEDVVIAISASGNSPNVIAGLTAASARGAHSIGLLGFDGGKALSLVDVAIHVPSPDYGLVEAAHVGITHAITYAISQALRSTPQT